MRYILIILVFLSVGANAQMVIKAHPNYVPFAVAANLLLDDYPNAAAAYSLRKLRTAYTGSAVRVRKDTTGQPEQDIGFTASGDLDTAAIKSFLNARSGFVVTWYDQSGNARNATQATQANQPRIVNAGVIERKSGYLAAVFDGSNDNLQNATTGFNVNNVTHYAVSSRGNTSATGRIIYSTGILAGSTNGFGFYYASASTQDNIFQQIRSGLNTTDIGNYANTLNTNNLIFGVGTSSRDSVYFNNANLVSNTIGSRSGNSTTNIIIGASFTSAPATTPRFFLNGSITEIVFWSQNRNNDRNGISNNINNYWSIY